MERGVEKFVRLVRTGACNNSLVARMQRAVTPDTAQTKG